MQTASLFKQAKVCFENALINLQLKKNMKTIYKYPLSIEDIQVLFVPVGAQILTVQIQGSQPYLWALIDKNEQRMVSRHLVTYGTGHDVSFPYLKYISTYQVQGGSLVYHVFEKLN